MYASSAHQGTITLYEFRAGKSADEAKKGKIMPPLLHKYPFKRVFVVTVISVSSAEKQ